jgi:Translation initiation factor IF-2, N-terminal region
MLRAMRVFELARQVGTRNRRVIEIARELGIPVADPMTLLSAEQVYRLRHEIAFRDQMN